MRWLIALVVVGCGAKQPIAETPVVDEGPAPTRVQRPAGLGAFVPRPTLELAYHPPDFRDELRWPLPAMSHPDLAPHFDVAKELAMPGVGWIELCARGAHNRTTSGRSDALTYLRGWCAAIDRDVDTACTNLVPLLRSDVPAIAAAVRQDLPNILADAGDSDRAEHWLTRHYVRDPRILDALAATYVEVGSSRDVVVINQRAVETDAQANAATQCRRLVRPMVLGNSSEQTAAYEQLKQLASSFKAGDPLCVQLERKARCWRSPSQCEAAWHEIAMRDLYDSWPTRAVLTAHWLGIAARAKDLLPAQGAAELMVAAFEGALAADAATCGTTIKGAMLQAESVMAVVKQAPPAGWAALRTRCALN